MVEPPRLPPRSDLALSACLKGLQGELSEIRHLGA